jgi:hypothetical protein
MSGMSDRDWGDGRRLEPMTIIARGKFPLPPLPLLESN